MSGNIHRLCQDDVTFIPVGPGQALGDQRQNTETRRSSAILGDSTDLEITRSESGNRSGPQAIDYKEDEEEAEDVLSESELKVTLIEGAVEYPLACGANNNQLLPPDRFDQDVLGGAIDIETSYDDKDVEIESSLPPKNSRIGQRSKCAQCDEMVSTSYMSRHLKRYHCPSGKNYKSAKSTRRPSKPKSVKIKCEYCGKGLAKNYLAKHIREVHQGKQCRWCEKAFSFKHSLSDHESSCSKNQDN